MKRCGWLRRHWHAHLRRVDLQITWGSIERKAEAAYPEDIVRATFAADVAWGVFTSMPGQEHWQCPCGKEAQP